ncbi:hypothetical protein F2Q68_00017874 [Brassica cretica]|uniref:Transcription factor CBF/NF-Y/archaeal histone domain-containing protein n=1 Tax=Brassica cretica TaxID=69181 RepID=A0A8S9HAA4_BRACR|nr:hypothetical protein F2Q68_00017874 [Brassica cretica]
MLPSSLPKEQEKGSLECIFIFSRCFVVYSKHCVETYNVFDFLREVVRKVPDYGQAQGQGQGDATMDDRSIAKKTLGSICAGYFMCDEVNDSNEECKKSKTQEVGNAKPSGRGSRGRGGGRGRGGRVARAAERENLNREMELEAATFSRQYPDACFNVITPREREEGCRWAALQHQTQTASNNIKVQKMALQDQTKTPSNNFKVQKKALTLIS